MCDLCNKIFTTKTGLINHIKRIHEKIISKTECTICEKVLETKNLKYHILVNYLGSVEKLFFSRP